MNYEAFADVAGKATKETFETMRKSFNGQKIDGSFKAINHIGRNYLGVGEAATRILKNNENFGTAIKNTFAKSVDKKGNVTKWNTGKIAGSFIGASVAGRVISGGGLTRDSQGNPNLIGVPFV